MTKLSKILNQKLIGVLQKIEFSKIEHFLNSKYEIKIESNFYNFEISSGDKPVRSQI